MSPVQDEEKQERRRRRATKGCRARPGSRRRRRHTFKAKGRLSRYFPLRVVRSLALFSRRLQGHQSLLDLTGHSTRREILHARRTRGKQCRVSCEAAKLRKPGPPARTYCSSSCESASLRDPYASLTAQEHTTTTTQPRLHLGLSEDASLTEWHYTTMNGEKDAEGETCEVIERR